MVNSALTIHRYLAQAVCRSFIGSPEGRPRRNGKITFTLIIIATALSGAFFALDLLLPLGVAAGVPYVTVVLLGLWVDNSQRIFLLALASSALVIIGYGFSPEGGILWVVLFNRTLALLAIWVTALLLVKAKRAETDLRMLNNELEQRVGRRTEELHSMQGVLLRKERLAAMGQLTGTVAHELRNPLGVIANSIHTIRRQTSTAGLGLESALDRVARNITRCDTIITELLDFARAKGLQLQRITVDTWLSDILAEYHISEGIALKCDFKADGAAVNLDPEQARRAIVNVLDNACQAMTNGSGENGAMAAADLGIATRTNGRRIEINITDTGPGIPEDILPQVLEPLFSTKSFGTGLGLPTVKKIMEEHGGGLNISCEQERGTRVTLWLPLGLANIEEPRV